MVIMPPEAIGEVAGEVFASGTLSVPHAALAVVGRNITNAIIASHARGMRRSDEKRGAQSHVNVCRFKIIRARIVVDIVDKVAQSSASNACKQEALSSAVRVRRRWSG